TFLVLFNCIFGHIYGIAFVGFVCLIRKELWVTALSVAHILATFLIKILFGYKRLSAETADFPPFVETVKQVLGTLSNPHRAVYIIAPMFCFGIYYLFMKNRTLFFKLSLVLVMTIIGPMAATYVAKYYFMPRQIVGGIFVYLAIAAFGF